MGTEVIDITPKIKNKEEEFIEFSKSLLRKLRKAAPEDRESILKETKESLINVNVKALKEPELALVFSQSLMLDLCLQDWQLTIKSSRAILEYPDTNGSVDHAVEKEKIRKRHLLARDSQLKEKSVAEFLSKMEKRSLTDKGWHSIFSLMRDGKDLAEQLSRLASIESEGELLKKLGTLISPYIQFVEPGVRCEHTGLFLSDIWRYFRHTWVNEYKSLPGRSIFVLIRDAAAPNHPVIGITALGSSVAQQGVRDSWIEWDSEVFIKKLVENPDNQKAKWLLVTLKELLKDIYTKDLIKEKTIKKSHLRNPDEKVLLKLRTKAQEYKEKHRLFPHKAKFNVESNEGMNWEERARTFLFKSKRCGMLGDLLSILFTFRKCGLMKGTKTELLEAIDSQSFLAAVGMLIRRAKAKRVGIDMMDIIVCGSIAPYNHILGGKLVCMLLTSPEIVTYYGKKYGNSPSLIASAMRGKKVIRKPKLVLLGTTSLYGIGSSQYNRIKIPAEKIDGKQGEIVEYKELGTSEGFGSFHFSSETLQWGNALVGRRKGGKRVNSIFGEGANPLMRKVRESFDMLGLESEPILKHGNKRVVYGISLASNFREILTGFEKRPKYFFPLIKPKEKTKLIADYWKQRWLCNRIRNPEIIDQLKQHTLSYPITHGARVPVHRAESSN